MLKYDSEQNKLIHLIISFPKIKSSRSNKRLNKMCLINSSLFCMKGERAGCKLPSEREGKSMLFCGILELEVYFIGN